MKRIANHVWLHTLIELVLILGLSELSYRFVEQNSKKWKYENVKNFFIQFKQPMSHGKKFQYGLLTAIVAIGLFGIVTAPKKVETKEQQAFKDTIQKNADIAKETLTKPKVKKPITEETENPKLTDEMKQVMSRYQLTEEQVLRAQNLDITAFGDSVMLGATVDLQEVFTYILVDAVVGRQLDTSVADLQSLADRNLLKDTVLIGLGTNGVASEAEFEKLMAVIGDRKVYLLNVFVPTQRWQNDVNRLLANMAKKYDNITLIDWYNYSDGQATWFREDSVHPNEIGLEAYTALIAQKILAK